MPDAANRIRDLDLDETVRQSALDVIEKGDTVIPQSVSLSDCHDMIAAFKAFEHAHDEIFRENRDSRGHYPRIVNLHTVFPKLAQLFTRNRLMLETQDALFGARSSLYTSLFYEVGSQQPLHRDSPLFATRPEYLYFGATVYLEPTDDENGCLEVLEGGHKIPEVDREAIALSRFGSLDNIPDMDVGAWTEYQNAVIAQGRAMGLVSRPIHVKAGDTLIWHPQLPHGGTPIKDPARTRFSLVMHITPETVGVYHQNVFFAPSRPFPEKAPWSYIESDGRLIADFRHGISFGHQRSYALERFMAQAN